MINIIEKNAVFVDYNGNQQLAKIRINPKVFIGIDLFNHNNEEMGYTRIYFHPDNRFYLDTIYCLDKFRGAGIATMISELADYVMSDYKGYVIRGVFEPTQMGTDRENNITCSELQLDTAARQFYAKNGYEIINYDDYIDNPKKYPYINSEDFQLSEEISKTIVAKVISKNNSFIEENGVIYHVDYENRKERKI